MTDVDIVRAVELDLEDLICEDSLVDIAVGSTMLWKKVMWKVIDGGIG